MNLKHFILSIFIVSLSLSSCKKENEEDLGDNCNTANITYSAEVRTILQSYCTGCHNQQLANGGIRLHNYENVMIYVNDGSLMGSINHDPGYVAMPLGQSKIPLCNIDQIQAWIDAGALDN
jgi:hypothetical protein